VGVEKETKKKMRRGEATNGYGIDGSQWVRCGGGYVGGRSPSRLRVNKPLPYGGEEENAKLRCAFKSPTR